MAYQVTLYNDVTSATYTDVIQDFKITYEADASSLSAPMCQMELTLNLRDAVQGIVPNAKKIKFGTGTTHYQLFFVTDIENPTYEVYKYKAFGMLSLLDKAVFPACYYDAVSNADFVDEIETMCPGVSIIFSNYSANTFSGYYPEQTARERLQMFALANGYVVIDGFQELELRRWADLYVNDELINPAKVFYTPKVNEIKPYTKITVRSYTYTRKTKSELSAGDSYYKFRLMVIDDTGTRAKWVDGGANRYYTYTHTDHTSILSSNADDEENELFVDIPGITEDTATAVLTYLTAYYSNNYELTTDIIVKESEPGTYERQMALYPSGQITICAGDLGIYTGIVKKRDLQSGSNISKSLYAPDGTYLGDGWTGKATLTVWACRSRDFVIITVRITLEDILTFKLVRYYLIKDSAYTLNMRWYDEVVTNDNSQLDGYRVIIYPQSDTITGTATATSSVQVYYTVAVKQELTTGDVYIATVYSAAMDGNYLRIY